MEWHVNGPMTAVGVGRIQSVDRSSYKEISDRADRARAIFQTRGVKLHRDSSLGKILRVANELSKSWEKGKRLGGIHEVLGAAQANRVAEAIIAVESEANALESLRRIAGNSMDLMGRSPSQGKDHLWELELRSILHRRGVSAELIDPPDIVATIKDFTVPIACKKVYSEKGVEAQVRKGVKQVEANGAGGLVALNVDDLLPGDAILKQRDHVSASAWLGVFVRQFIERNRFTFQRYVAQGRCDGILISATCVCDLEEGGPRFTTVTDTTLWSLLNLAPRALERLAALRQALQ
jgi:hypothetical protein